MSDNHLALVIRDLQKQLNEVRDSLQLQIDQLVVERDRSVCLLEEAGITQGHSFGFRAPEAKSFAEALPGISPSFLY